MNKDNAKDFLPLVQALAEGKTIQMRTAALAKWEDVQDTVGFGMSLKNYRIKPEPREFELWARKEDEAAVVVREFHTTQAWLMDGYTKIKVREVL